MRLQPGRGPPVTRRIAALLLACALALPALAQEGAQTVLHLLAYVGADYGGAVENGSVKSADEYKEMVEFTAQALDGVKALPDNPAKAALVNDAAALAKLVADKVDAASVAQASARLRWALIGAYKLQVAPRRAPDLARGAALYAANCASCHGAQGRGDGPVAKGLDPAPADFHDAARMANRSLYGIYSTITLGVTGTSMAAFRQLGEDDRWALAFFAAGFGVPAERVKAGEALWKSPAARKAFPDLAALTSLSANEVLQRHGNDAALVHDYLRAHPEALAAGKPMPIEFARQKLAEGLAAYNRGDRAAAREAATTAYLEGFELVEAGLDNVDKPLRLAIEHEMLGLRAAFGGEGTREGIAKSVAQIDTLLAQAQDRLAAGELTPGAAFASSVVILMREGLEAILLLAAIIAFVTRTGRRDALPYVHAGWILALLLGAATWAVASFLIGISGANREMTEGVTALIASAMLLYVGYWLHGKGQAAAWGAFIRDSIGQALQKRTLWAMAGVSFVAVYREVFEVVLFYEALWVQAGTAGHGAVLGGIGLAIVLLAVTAWAIFRYSLRLPLGPFFTAMSLLMALLAVVFAGQGVAALQEAGVVSSSHVPFFTVSMLGIHPTLESLGAQALTAAIVMLGMHVASRGARPHASAKS
ncbi:MAG: cytochrome c/FTR1 family iron permease [Proteobacteria bacterium]|nr:cytochrome c/FTR1 family iron permease [Pseudomonadota bacterium]